MEHASIWKKSAALITATLLVAAIFCLQHEKPVYAASDDESKPQNVQPAGQLGLLVTGQGVNGTVGFQKDILYLTQEELEQLQNEKNPQNYGLGNSWRENQYYSSYDNHGTGTYHYSLADGLDVNTILDTVVEGGLEAVNFYWIWSADTYSSKITVNTSKSLKYFAPGDRTGVPAAAPLIAFYKTTNAATDPQEGAVPTGKADKLQAKEAVFVYGQFSPEDDNNCHYIKSTDALYVENPKTLVLTDNFSFIAKRLKDFMEQGIYKTSYTFESSGEKVTHNVEGTPLSAVLKEMNLSSFIPEYSKNRLEIVSGNGEKTYVSGADIEKCFVAWGFTDERATPSAQTGQLAVYLPGETEQTAVAYNLSKLNIVDEKGAIVTAVPQQPVQMKPPAAPKDLKAIKNSYSSIKLTWKEVSDADGYTIYRYHPKTNVYTRLKTVSAGTTAFTDKNLAVNTTYRYKISAYCKKDGVSYESSCSAAASAKPALDKPSITKLSKKGKTAAVVKWKGAAGADGYQIYRASGKAGTYKKVGTVKKGSVKSFTDKTVKTGVSYSYKVRPYRMVNGTARYGSFSAVKRLKG